MSFRRAGGAMVSLAPSWSGRAGARAGLRRASVALALLLCGAALAGPARGWPGWIALALFLAVAGVARRGLDGFHPPERFGAANTVTLARAAGMALLAGLALTGRVPATPGVAWGLAGAAAALLALDGVDGWLARRDGTASAFGARFDMEVDALLCLALALLAWQSGKAGPEVLGLGLMRPAFLALGWRLPVFAAPLAPSFRRRAVCAITLAALVLLITPPLAPPASLLLAWSALALLAASFGRDIRALARR